VEEELPATPTLQSCTFDARHRAEPRTARKGSRAPRSDGSGAGASARIVAPSAHVGGAPPYSIAHKTCGLVVRTAVAAAAVAAREATDPELAAAMAVKRTREHFAGEYRIQVASPPPGPVRICVQPFVCFACSSSCVREAPVRKYSALATGPEVTTTAQAHVLKAEAPLAQQPCFETDARIPSCTQQRSLGT
jgi:hypothetical protein